MKKFVCLLAAGLVAGVMSTVGSTAPSVAVPADAPRETILLTASIGHDIYTPGAPYQNGGGVLNPIMVYPEGWNYGPSMIFDGPVLHMYTCSKSADGDAWDQLNYLSSTDNGATWTAPVLTMKVSNGTADGASICDPSVIRVGSYYYLAYTGISETATNGEGNQVFVARSSMAAGPWQKWNGTGWGGDPAPIVTPPPTGYGVGEPSLVLVDYTLYLYYSYYDGTHAQTRLATADLNGLSFEQWPTVLQYEGVAIDRAGQSSNIGVTGGGNVVEDSTDVKYIPAWDKFIGIATSDRFKDDSAVKLYESTDGKHFTKALATNADWQSGIHNIGISGNRFGHLDPYGYNVISYAYPDEFNLWGRWKTHLSPVTLSKVSTGSVDLPLATASQASSGSWADATGTWIKGSSGGSLQQTSSTIHPAYTTLVDTAFGEASYEVDVKLPSSSDPAQQQNWVGINFNKVNPGDSYGQSGYLVFLRRNGKVSLYKGGLHAPGVQVSDKATGTDPTAGYVHLRIVHSHGDVHVYVGNTSTPQISFKDTTAQFYAGSMSLVTSLTAADFKNLVISDNVSPSFQSTDWSAEAGTWSVPAPNQVRSTSTNPSTPGDVNTLMTTSTTGYTAPWVGGDGTYHAAIKMDPTAPATAKARVGITIFEGLGYRVSVRGDGYVGLEGPGGVALVAPTATGLDPRSAPVDLRILKRGTSVQVFVDDGELPFINFFDTATTPQIGRLVLYSTAPTTFTDVGYEANGDWPGQ